MVAQEHDLRAGTDVALVEQFQAIAATAKKERRRMTEAEVAQRRALSKAMTTNPHLKGLWSVLRRRLPKLGFAVKYPFQLLPIRKDAKAIAGYYADNYLKTAVRRTKAMGRFNTRGCSQSAPIAVASSLSFSSRKSTEWRRQVAVVAGAFGFTSLDQLKASFGTRWAYKMRRVVAWMKAQYMAGASRISDEAIRAQAIFELGAPAILGGCRSPAVLLRDDRLVAELRHRASREGPAAAYAVPAPGTFAPVNDWLERFAA